MRPDGKLLRDPVCFLAFGLGLGLMPWMPGTFGGLLAFPVIWLAANWPLLALVALAVVMSVAGIFICGHAGRRLGVEDHGGIVWDEVCGAFIAMLAVPPQWLWWIAAFVLFRVFDIVKPWPVNWFDEHVPGGLGVMLDDIAAGVMAAAVLVLARLVAGA